MCASGSGRRPSERPPGAQHTWVPCRSGEYAHCTQPRQSGQKVGQRVSGPGAGEGLVLLEGALAPPSVVGEALGGSRRCDRDIDLRVEARAVLADSDKSIRVTGCHSQFLMVICVPVDIAGALEVQVGLKLGEGLVLLVLLHKPEAELGLKLGPGGE
jgi:hypothetical protein